MNNYTGYAEKPKKLIIIFIIILTLTGCSHQDDYAQILKEWSDARDRTVIEAAQAETANVTAQLHVSQQQTANITADLHNANREIEQLKAQLARSYTQQDIDGLHEAIKAYGVQYEALNNQYVELQGMYSKLFHDNQELQKSYDKLKKESENWTADND